MRQKNIDYEGTLATAGTKTGERAIVQLVDPKVRFTTLDELGIRPKMQQQLLELLGREPVFTSTVQREPQVAADQGRVGRGPGHIRKQGVVVPPDQAAPRAQRRKDNQQQEHEGNGPAFSQHGFHTLGERGQP